jgi:hypothetical protein
LSDDTGWRLLRFHDAERDDASGEETMAAGVGWKVSATAGTNLQMATEFIKTSTETRRGCMAFEAAHRPVSPLNPAMVLLDPVVQISAGPVFRVFVQLSPDRARVTVMTIRRDTRGNDAGHRFGRSKECLRRLHVARFAQPHIDQRAEAIDGTIKVAPAAVHLDICLVDIPTLSDPALAPLPEAVDQGRCELRLPAAGRLVAEFDPRIRNISGGSRRLSL